MKIDLKQFRVPPGHKVKLKHWPTRIKPIYDSKEEYASILEHHVAQMSDLQGRLYAEARHATLIIFQAMDAAGKDGAIKHVMSGVNPQGCEVFSFKEPSAEELSHDFLWRTTLCLPARGRIGIFNRSYYEEVLVVRVHPELLDKQHLPTPLQRDPDIWRHRFHSINEYEKHLARNGVKIVKIFLHLSKTEQKHRLLKRIERPDKHWKISFDDIRERARWKDYMKAYEDCLAATSSKEASWYCVPADDKPNARLIISQILIDTLKGLKIQPPQSASGKRADLRKMRRALLAGKS
jgi:PPK2 family polyphosphate:nucleotide phosphotransferase